MCNHRAGPRKGEVSDQPAFLVEDERANRHVELELGPGAAGLAPAGPVGARLGLPVRSLLVER